MHLRSYYVRYNDTARCKSIRMPSIKTVCAWEHSLNCFFRWGDERQIDRQNYCRRSSQAPPHFNIKYRLPRAESKRVSFICRSRVSINTHTHISCINNYSALSYAHKTVDEPLVNLGHLWFSHSSISDFIECYTIAQPSCESAVSFTSLLEFFLNKKKKNEETFVFFHSLSIFRAVLDSTLNSNAGISVSAARRTASNVF